MTDQEPLSRDGHLLACDVQQQWSKTCPVSVQTSLPFFCWQQHCLMVLPVKPHTTAPAKAVVATAVAASVASVFLMPVIVLTSLSVLAFRRTVSLGLDSKVKGQFAASVAFLSDGEEGDAFSTASAARAFFTEA
ncbi:MAG TPA: hypothetical protein VFF11_00420 [Candidatus Binatia bacterium]|nr:hypothetical protein [Candidatus Binatia bacterium]